MSMTTESREAPPEAQLIRRYREAMGISPEVAADRLEIKMSARRWRQIEAGEETKGGKPADASAGQLAHMAKVVGARPEQLRELGHAEAAEILMVIEERASLAEADTPSDPMAALPSDPEQRQAVLWEMLEQRTRETAEITAEIQRLRRERETG